MVVEGAWAVCGLEERVEGLERLLGRVLGGLWCLNET